METEAGGLMGGIVAGLVSMLKKAVLIDVGLFAIVGGICWLGDWWAKGEIGIILVIVGLLPLFALALFADSGPTKQAIAGQAFRQMASEDLQRELRVDVVESDLALAFASAVLPLALGLALLFELI